MTRLMARGGPPGGQANPVKWVIIDAPWYQQPGRLSDAGAALRFQRWIPDSIAFVPAKHPKGANIAQ